MAAPCLLPSVVGLPEQGSAEHPSSRFQSRVSRLGFQPPCLPIHISKWTTRERGPGPALSSGWNRGSIRAASCRALVGCAQRGAGLRKKLVELGWMAGGEIWGDTIPAYFQCLGHYHKGGGAGRFQEAPGGRTRGSRQTLWGGQRQLSISGTFLSIRQWLRFLRQVVNSTLLRMAKAGPDAGDSISSHLLSLYHVSHILALCSLFHDNSQLGFY